MCCHPERSERSGSQVREMLRCAQHDIPGCGWEISLSRPPTAVVLPMRTRSIESLHITMSLHERWFPVPVCPAFLLMVPRQLLEPLASPACAAVQASAALSLPAGGS